MDKIKILILNSSAIYGGGEYFVLKLASELQKRKYDVTVGCGNRSLLYKKLNESSIKTEYISFPEEGSGDLWKNIKGIKKIIARDNVDIVHSNTGYDRTAAAFAARGTNAKHITSCHSLESISHNITHYIRNKFLTHHFIADGTSIKNLITTQDNIPLSKVTVVHNGINSDEMSRDIALREKIRNEFNIKNNENLIGSVGRLVSFKGYKYMLTAFKLVLEELPDTKLMIIGDGELMNSLKEHAEVLHVDKRVIFSGFRDDLQAVYSAFDIYANTSISGGGELFPFSILYAMAQGIPIVASRVGDIPEMVKDNSNGCLVEEKSPYRISEKLIELLKDKNKAELLGAKGKLIMEENFTLAMMTDKIEKIYKNALK